MYVYKLVPGSLWVANGGPAKEIAAEKATPTRAGRFVIGSIGPHVSNGRWRNSAVPWGAPVRLSAKEKYVEVQIRGKWVFLHTLPGWSSYFATNPLGAKAQLVNDYRGLMNQLRPKYGLSRSDHWPAGWDGDLPSTWVFNDFGRVAVKYFADYNGNRKLDASAKGIGRREELLSDFMHTTPASEIALALDQKLASKATMVLGESHGCIHMDPEFLQKWIAGGKVAVGVTLEIHPYKEVMVPPASFERPWGRLGTEVHFFPGANGIALYHVSKKQLGHPLHLPRD